MTMVRRAIDIERFLASAGQARRIVVDGGEVIFSEGEDADSLMHVLKGLVTLSVSGRGEAVVRIVGAGDSLGEECLADPIRKRTATALTRSTLLVISKTALCRLLGDKPALAQRFMTHLLSRRMRVEDDLIHQLRSSHEEWLARTLLILSGYGTHGRRTHTVPRMSQGTLASIVGSTRSRINLLLHKFSSLGFISMGGSLTVHRSLLRVLLPAGDRPRVARAGSSLTKQPE